MDDNRPRLEWLNRPGKHVLKFTFGERLSEADAREAIEEWRAELLTRPGQKVVHIWDATHMKSYDSAARTVWQQTMKKLADQIDRVWLISGSPLVRMGASVMSMFSSLEVTAVPSEDDIHLD